MAGVVIDAGSGGATVATDQIDDVDHQLVKLEYGEAGSATQASATNPLPVIDDEGVKHLLEQILTEMRAMNFYLSSMTDLQIETE